MATVKLKLPPGFYHNGTDYTAAGRYVDGNLVRWHNDVIKTINGWQKRYDLAANTPAPPLWSDGLATEAARSCIVLSNLSSGVDVYIGSNKKIYHISNSNVIADVTPAGFSPQPKDSTLNRGYGIFRYGFGKYGSPRPSAQGKQNPVFSWGFAEWGEWPIACARGIATYPLVIKKTTDVDFITIPNSPKGTFDVIVTDERFAMTFGKTTDQRLVEWSDQEDYLTWDPAIITKQTGNRRLAGTGRLVCGVKALGQILILGENDAFSCQYVGPPYVYGFNRVGDKCGVIGAEAVAVTQTFAAWIGAKSFWIFDGSVKQLPCDVLDYYLRDRDDNQKSKTHAFAVSDYSEVWWLYQSTSSETNDVDSYIVFNHAKNVWYYGRIDRTVGVDNDPLEYNMMISPYGYIYDHEVTGANYDGAVPYITTGPLETESGDRLMACSYVYPDEYADGSVLMELNVRDMPKDPVRFRRQFDISRIAPGVGISTQGIMGRDIRMKLYSAETNAQWMIGDFRISTPGGAGPRR